MIQDINMSKLPEGVVKVSALETIRTLMAYLTVEELDTLDVALWAEISSRDSRYFGLDEEPDCPEIFTEKLAKIKGFDDE